MLCGSQKIKELVLPVKPTIATWFLRLCKILAIETRLMMLQRNLHKQLKVT